MQIFHLISVVIPLLLALSIPMILRRYTSKREMQHRWLLYVACGLFFVSWYLPSPLIDGRDTSFVTHVVGGGMFTGLLWLYIKRALRWRSHWVIEATSLFALVSALGAVNELAELAMVELGVATILLGDTNWDILANTLGATLVYLTYIVCWNDSRN